MPTVDEMRRAGFEIKGEKAVKVNYANDVRQTAAPDQAGIARGDNPIVQKQQTDNHQVSKREASGAGADNHQAGVSGDHANDGGRFRATIVVRFPTNRRTDLSGKLDTILDCIIRARGRLLAEHNGDRSAGREVRARKRRMLNPNRKTVKFVPTQPPPF